MSWAQFSLDPAPLQQLSNRPFDRALTQASLTRQGAKRCKAAPCTAVAVGMDQGVGDQPALAAWLGQLPQQGGRQRHKAVAAATGNRLRHQAAPLAGGCCR